MSTTDGRPTNALFGFLSMVFRVMDDEKPDAIVVCMDSPGKTFRHAEYAEYKGTRKEMPPEMLQQIPVAREMITALGIPQIEITGYEADDIIGTLSLKAESQGYKTTIITGDLDALQLVDEHVTVITPKVGVTEVSRYDPAAVHARYGFGPEHVTDYKAMAGDSSDNIPGVPGIGDKSATALIQKFGSIEQILARFDEVDEKFRKKIEPHRDQMPKSKWLVTIERAAPVEWDFAPYKLTADQVETAKKFLENLEFKNFIKRLPTILGRYTEGFEMPSAAAVEVEKLEIIDKGAARSLADLESWLGESPYGIYMTPASQQNMFEETLGQVFVAKGREVMAASIEVADALFTKRAADAITHDAKPWQARTKHYRPARFDSMLAAYVLQPGRGQYGVRDVVQGYLEVEAPEKPAEVAAALALLEKPMRERLEKEDQTRVLDEVELPLTPILAEMEGYGIQVSKEFLQDFSKSLEVSIQQSQKLIYEMAGCEFVIGSPKQLGEVLFEKLNIPGQKKTKTGYATGAEILQVLAPQYPIASEVMTYRELTKLKSTYADALPKMIREDGRIHTSFNQAVAATGRLSSNDPNLQNIPIRTELGRKIRQAFVAAPGFELGSFDYSQIELRLLAHLCHDEVLVDAFQKRVDVHTVTAALMFHLEQDQVTKEQRRLAKMLNYAVLYGVTDFGLANQLGGGFSVSEAKQLIQQYYERFPTVKKFTEGVVEEARAKGFTVTMIGRRRYFPDIHAANRNERLYAERQAINAPIQGAAADMIKMAMIQVRRGLDLGACRMLLQVHDELVFEVPVGDRSALEPIRASMENALPLSVPVEVDAKIGASWNSMTEFGRGA